MQAPEPAENWLNALGIVAGGAVVAIGMWLRSYLAGRAEGAGDVHGKHVILEQAELRDFGSLPQQLRELGTKLDQALSADQLTRAAVEENGRRMEEQLRILRRLESEIDLAKRLREERLLRLRDDDREG